MADAGVKTAGLYRAPLRYSSPAMWPSLLTCLCLTLAGGITPPPEAAAEPPDRAPEAESAAAFADVVVVTAARREERLTEATAFTSIVTGESLRRSPFPDLDSALRQVPGFSLFRRSSSLDSHPTTQGVSLRGIGPSGTSRTLVLFDGLPLNDPFGGWIIWNRYPPSSLDRVEVVRGGGSAVWGSASLGGTIQLLPRLSAETTLEVAARAGQRGLLDLDVFAAGGGGTGDASPWAWSLAGRGLDSDGDFLLAPEELGAVDRPARVGLGAFVARLHRGPYHGGVQLYREERGNGTVLQENATRLALLEGGFSGGRWSWTLYGQRQRLESTFSRVLPGRDAEFPTARQDIPSTALGGSVLLRSAPGDRLGSWLIGADLRRVSWEDAPAGDLRQTLAGVFLQRTFEPTPRLEILAGGRLDAWENRDTQLTVNPRVGLVFAASSAWTLRSSLYRGFRAPTLNELYRPFRVGNVITDANPELDEEHLTGLELGTDWTPPGHRAGPRLRLNVFLNDLDDPVGNVTLAVAPQEILRRRQNLGRVRVRGLELEGGASLGRRWRVEASYLLSDGEVEATRRPLPQAPRHQAGVRLTGSSGPMRMTLQGRWASEAFEDDRGELSLGGLRVVDAAVAFAVGRRWELLALAENLLDRRAVTGRLPEERLGAPRRLAVGVRFRSLP